MSDDLAILMSVILSREMPRVETPLIFEAVQVMIRELGLREEREIVCDTGPRYRYVTDWEADDE